MVELCGGGASVDVEVDVDGCEETGDMVEVDDWVDAVEVEKDEVDELDDVNECLESNSMSESRSASRTVL